jgi:segregation and condensation protein B
METPTPIQIIEALLFSTPHAMTAEQIGAVVDIRDKRRIQKMIEELNHFYDQHQRSFFIEAIAGGYQLRTQRRFQPWIKKGRNVKAFQLSPSVLETLSIVAYHQPVTRAEVESIRAVDSTYSLRTLLDKKLIRIIGRKDIMGRPLIYGTTRFFLETFGFQSLADLPKPQDFDLIENLDETVTPSNNLL